MGGPGDGDRGWLSRPRPQLVPGVRFSTLINRDEAVAGSGGLLGLGLSALICEEKAAVKAPGP